MPAGASPKREREYKKLVRQFHRDHRYQSREEEVAARIVNKQRKAYGETKDEKQLDIKGESPDRYLPIKDYQQLTVSQIAVLLKSLPSGDIRKIRHHELTHKHRKGLLMLLTRYLSAESRR